MTNSTLIKLIVYTCAVILIVMFTCPAGAELYPLTTVITDLDYANNLVICTDYIGNNWVFEEIEDWDIGDIVSIIMDDMDTEIIYDDEIIIVRYGGYWG